MQVFDLYAAYYDLLYRDKDYSSEAQYVASLIGTNRQHSSILEMGCGTGGHAFELSRLGFKVTGFDVSSSMIARAKSRQRELPPVGPRPDFTLGDVKTFRIERRFDAVISLFHVMSYQTRNDDLRAAIRTARAHLIEGGVFVFDFWYGPAVLSDRPKHVTRHARDESIEVVRRTTPAVDVNRNRVDIRFDIEIISRVDHARRTVEEVHSMRYLFLPEIEDFLDSAGFRLESCFAWMSASAPSDSSWYACVLARAQ